MLGCSLIELPPNFGPSRKLVLRADGRELGLQSDDFFAKAKEFGCIVRGRAWEVVIQTPKLDRQSSHKCGVSTYDIIDRRWTYGIDHMYRQLDQENSEQY